jgi:hypothetical protein
MVKKTQTEGLDNQRKLLSKKFTEFLRDASLVSFANSIKRTGHTAFGRSYGSNNAVLHWNKQPYEDAIEQAHMMFPNIAKKTIGQAFQNAMIELFELAVVGNDADPHLEAHLDSVLEVLNSVAISEKVKELCELLESKVGLFTVLIPMEGIEVLSKLDLEIATIYSKDIGPLDDFLKVNESDDIENSLRETFKQSHCYLVIDIEGDSSFVAERGPELAQDVIHILNFYLASITNRIDRSYHRIRIAGTESSVHERIVVYFRTNNQYGSHWKVLSSVSYNVNSNDLGKWNEWGLQDVIACFGSSDPNSITGRIRRSITWYSKAISAENWDEQFVALAISLESLLVGNEGKGVEASWGSISQKLAERVAFLLGTNYENRIRLEKDAKTLYGVRSKIVHEGLTVSRENLILMDDIVHASISNFHKRKFKTWDAFLNWEKEQRYKVVPSE